MVYANYVDRSGVTPPANSTYYVRYVTGSDINDIFEISPGNKFLFEVNPQNGKVKTLSQLTAEREASRNR